MRGVFLPPTYDAIVRLVHAMGAASHGDLLSAYQAGPMQPANLRKATQELFLLGWLDKTKDTRPGAHARGVLFSVTEEGLAHLPCSGRLPRRPTWLHRAPPLPPAPQPPSPEPPAAPVPPTPGPYRPAFAPWVPPPDVPAREGALDYKRCRSLGATGGGRTC